MALQVAKRAASAMGLKAAKLALLDQLFAFTKARDWTDPQVSPIVWPTNELLARRLGVGISTMKHHLNGLAEAGLISYCDHPTYQRGGRRDEDGRIVEAHGIDLSPLAIRYGELLDLAETAEADARLCHHLRMTRTALRREIETLIASARLELDERSCDEACGDTEDDQSTLWQAFQARLDVLREESLADNEARQQNIEALQALRDEVEDAFEALFTYRNFHSAVPISRPLQTTAHNPESEPCKDGRNCANAQYSDLTEAFGQRAFEKKPAEAEVPRQAPKETVDAQDAAEAVRDDIVNISLPLLKLACPNLAETLPGSFDNWSAFRISGASMCVIASINPQVYHEAQQVLGANLALAALALTAERYSTGAVTNAGAYLRTLVKRGRIGELFLSKSLFALARSNHHRLQ